MHIGKKLKHAVFFLLLRMDFKFAKLSRNFIFIPKEMLD